MLGQTLPDISSHIICAAAATTYVSESVCADDGTKFPLESVY